MSAPTYTLLLIDDDRDNLTKTEKLIHDRMETKGRENPTLETIISTISPKEGHNHLRSTTIDLVLMTYPHTNYMTDITEIAGIDFLNRIKTEKYDVPVILSTSTPLSQDTRISLVESLGVIDFIKRPIGLADIDTTITKTIEEIHLNRPVMGIINIPPEKMEISQEISERIRETGINIDSAINHFALDRYECIIDAQALHDDALRLIRDSIVSPTATYKKGQRKEEAQRISWIADLGRRAPHDVLPFIRDYVDNALQFEKKQTLLYAIAGIQDRGTLGRISNHFGISENEIFKLRREFPLTSSIGNLKSRSNFQSLQEKVLNNLDLVNKMIQSQGFVYLEEEGKIGQATEKSLKEYSTMISFIGSLHPDEQVLIREEKRIKFAGNHPTYIISFPLIEGRGLSYLVKTFTKDSEQPEKTKEKKKLFRTEDEMAQLRRFYDRKSPKSLVTHEDDRNFYIIRPFVRNIRNTAYLEDIVSLMKDKGIPTRGNPATMNAFEEVEVYTAALHNRIRPETELTDEILKILTNRSNLTADTHTMRYDYLSSESLDIFGRIRKNVSRFIEPLIEQGFIPEIDEESPTPAIVSLQRLSAAINSYIEYHSPHRFPKLPGTDGFLCNMINEDISFDGERIKEITQLGEASLPWQRLAYDVDSRTITIERIADLLKARKQENGTFLSTKAGSEFLASLGFDEDEASRLSLGTEIPVIDYLRRAYVRRYNQTLVRPSLDSTDPFTMTRKMYQYATDDGDISRETARRLNHEISNLPGDLTSIDDYLAQINHAINAISSNEITSEEEAKSLKNISRRIMRHVNYVSFIGLNQEEKETRMKRVLENELSFIPNAAHCLLSYASGKISLIDFITTIDYSKGIDSCLEEISSELKTCQPQHMKEPLTEKVQQIFTYLSHLERARPRQPITDYHAFRKDPFPIQKCMEIYGHRWNFSKFQEDDHTRQNEISYMPRILSKIERWTMQFLRDLSTEEKEEQVLDFMRSAIRADAGPQDIRLGKNYLIYADDLRVSMEQAVREGLTTISSIRRRYTPEKIRHLQELSRASYLVKNIH